MTDDKLTTDINDWLCKLPRKEFEYVLFLRDKEANRTERLQVQIATLTAEIERLRHHLEVMIDTAEDRMPAQRPSIPHDYEPYDRDLADIAAARAALQPKEGE